MAKKFAKNERVFCYHKRILYEAEIINCKTKYKVRYLNWDKKYDEWVTKASLLKHNKTNTLKYKKFFAFCVDDPVYCLKDDSVFNGDVKKVMFSEDSEKLYLIKFHNNQFSDEWFQNHELLLINDFNKKLIENSLFDPNNLKLIFMNKKRIKKSKFYFSIIN